MISNCNSEDTKGMDKANNDLPEWVNTIADEEAMLRESWPPRAAHDMDWALPTYQVYYDPDCVDCFTPDFKTARGKLDYSYHKNPARSRQELQDVILTRVVAAAAAAAAQMSDDGDDREEEEEKGGGGGGGETNKAENKCSLTSFIKPKANPTIRRHRPWLVFSAGPMGVGKGYVLSTLNERGVFPLDRFLKIDPDMLKSELPEMTGYMQVDPGTAATKVHRESTQMADILLEYALQARLPTLVDGSLRDVDYYRYLMQRIRTDFPEYQLAIIHVTASPEIIRSRAQSRAEKTGRAVPTELLEGSIAQVPKSVAALSPHVDITYTIANEDDQPVQLIKSKSDDPGDKSACDESKTSPLSSLSWKDFRSTWWRDLGSNDETDIEHLSSWHESQCPGICQMAHCFCDNECIVGAKRVYAKAYPSFCPSCTLGSDIQCGICIHDIHYCACQECRHLTI